MNNANITRMSALYAPTLKEDPTDAEIASHKLLLRAGFIRKTAAGIYTFLPLGKRVLTKIENIVREEMDACGAQEIRMPMLQPEELWQESGRADAYGPERMRLNDRHDHEFCLGPTHEELITALVRAELRSYKQLPLNMYQIQTKFRDEIRPRFGLLRSREFVMKDGYSFHDTQESLQEEYDRMYAAYERICARCGLEFRPVQADAGQIGGAVTCEFHALAEAGESALVYCDCGYAASDEVGEGLARPTVYDVPEMEKVATPGVHTIAELVRARCLQLHGSAELTLYGDGCDAVSEHLIRAALRVRRQYFPGLLITFVEIGSGQGQNIAKYMAARQDITYLE